MLVNNNNNYGHVIMVKSICALDINAIIIGYPYV
jgi:hypothetical protein